MLFNLLTTSILPTKVEGSTDVVNVADSLKNTAQSIVHEAAADPTAFAQKVLEEFVDFGLKLLAAIAIYIIGAWLIRKVKRAIEAAMRKRKTEKTLSTFISSLVSIVLTVMLVLVTISALGINTTSIAAILGAGAVAIGMALSSTMENFAGGLIILIFKPFKAGDFISVDGFSGTVTDVTIVSTKIVTPDNRTIVLPNGTISNGKIDNYFSKGVRRIDIPATVEYGVDAQQCIDALVEIALANEKVLKGDAVVEPATQPYAILKGLNDSNVEFTLRAWVKSEEYFDAKAELNLAVYTELPKKGFVFAFPHLDVTMKN